ncbi:MAG: formate dehydrogenase accessory sulfurtransferase FdhD [Bacteroidota bacterium]|nr:formate dehydrogenase accessory sulfurtransferase FdhD [Bacteroidota bacterium]
MKRSSALPTGIIKVNSEGMHRQDDMLAAEEPLEIRISFFDSGKRLQKSISVTMRTPGNDFELSTGFLFTEGIIKSVNDINTIKHCNGLHENVVRIDLKDDVEVELSRLERNFYTTSSCGVCGKSSLEAVKTVRRYIASNNNDALRFSSDIISGFPAVLRGGQAIFDSTGGLHACGLFDTCGKLLITREDVGRHNALDKLIGTVLNQTVISFESSLLLLSGRASFELIQKAYMAGIKVVAAIGAPSSLAVRMAEEFGMTLIGFLKGRSFNIYTGAERITMAPFEKWSQS